MDSCQLQADSQYHLALACTVSDQNRLHFCLILKWSEALFQELKKVFIIGRNNSQKIKGKMWRRKIGQQNKKQIKSANFCNYKALQKK